jgi:hypothetical protein
MQDPWYICHIRQRDNGKVRGILPRLVDFGIVFFLLVSYAKIFVMFPLQYIHTRIYLFHKTHTHTHPSLFVIPQANYSQIDKPTQHKAGLSGDVIKIHKYNCNVSHQTISER